MEYDYSRAELRSYTLKGLRFIDCCSRGRCLEEADADFNVARNYQVGLAITLAVPGFAQQKETVDPDILEQLAALGKKIHEAWSKNDAAALAATYTEDAVLVHDTGPVYGREAIEKHYADLFKQVHFSNNIGERGGRCLEDEDGDVERSAMTD
jgi:hypothetical protein